MIMRNSTEILINRTSDEGDQLIDPGAAVNYKDFSFVIINTGNADLTLTNSSRVVISGAAAADYTLHQIPSSIIAPGNSSSFIIRFTPAPDSKGIRTVTLSIPNNDSNENPFTFYLTLNAYILTTGSRSFTAPGAHTWRPVAAINGLYTGNLLPNHLTANITLIGCGGPGDECEDETTSPPDYYDLCGGDGEVIQLLNKTLDAHGSYQIFVGSYYMGNTSINGNMEPPPPPSIVYARCGSQAEGGVESDSSSFTCQNGSGYQNNYPYGQGGCGYNSPGGPGAVLITWSGYVCE
jgi:hypothetical protein